MADDGTMIVRSGAVIAKLDTAGEIVWRVDTGDNRYVHPIGVTTDGALMFRTTMAEMHTPGDVHIYYPTQPDELFTVSRCGAILTRTKLDAAPRWPASQPWTAGFRSGRLPPS